MSRKARIDWKRYEEILLEGTRSAIKQFLEQCALDDICAIGFVFELCNASPCFELCADTWSRRNSTKGWDLPRLRWNSGEYEYHAGLWNHDGQWIAPTAETEGLHELGQMWTDEYNRLHELLDTDDMSVVDEGHKGLIRISCRVLVKLACEDLLGD